MNNNKIYYLSFTFNSTKSVLELKSMSWRSGSKFILFEYLGLVAFVAEKVLYKVLHKDMDFKKVCN